MRKNGELGGYRFGIERKRALLEREQAAAAKRVRKTGTRAVSALDGPELDAALDERGWAVVPGLVPPADCGALVAGWEPTRPPGASGW